VSLIFHPAIYQEIYCEEMF